jgi:hypothetical protein
LWNDNSSRVFLQLGFFNLIHGFSLYRFRSRSGSRFRSRSWLRRSQLWYRSWLDHNWYDRSLVSGYGRRVRNNRLHHRYRLWRNRRNRLNHRSRLNHHGYHWLRLNRGHRWYRNLRRGVGGDSRRYLSHRGRCLDGGVPNDCQDCANDDSLVLVYTDRCEHTCNW